MKRKILIIEDNYYKFFTMKQMIESILKLKVNVIGAQDESELKLLSAGVGANDVLVKPEGGVMVLVEQLRRRRFNRRNSEVTFIITPELDRDSLAKVNEICIANAA